MQPRAHPRAKQANGGAAKGADAGAVAGGTGFSCSCSCRCCLLLLLPLLLLLLLALPHGLTLSGRRLLRCRPPPPLPPPEPPLLTAVQAPNAGTSAAGAGAAPDVANVAATGAAAWLGVLRKAQFTPARF